MGISKAPGNLQITLTLFLITILQF